MSEPGRVTYNQPVQVWTVADYIAAFQARQPIEVPHDAPIRGRILRGRTEEDFAILGSAERCLAFIMGPDGLSALPGMEPLQALDYIGLTPEFVQGKIAQGFQFRLIVFNGGSEAPLATWDNVLAMVAQARPTIREDILRHWHALPTLAVADIERRLGQSLDSIELAGFANPNYLPVELYERLTSEERADPVNLRRALLHSDHVGTLFAGDGYTRGSDGTIGAAEYIVRNGAVNELADATLIPLL